MLVKPLTFHDRTEQILHPDKSKVQQQLQEIVEYSIENEMKINKSKTKAMLFNTARTRDFTPKLNIEGDFIDVVEEMKLLGVKITSDLKWSANTQYTTNRAYKKLWMLRRLKAFGANQTELTDIYCKHIRFILEFAAVVWHSGLSQENIGDIERVQKSACAIILGKEYESYENALYVLNLEKLSARRQTLCLKFAKRAFKSDKFSSWFVPDKKTYNTRRKMCKTKPAQARTTRFKKSPLPYLTSLLNISDY